MAEDNGLAALDGLEETSAEATEIDPIVAAAGLSEPEPGVDGALNTEAMPEVAEAPSVAPAEMNAPDAPPVPETPAAPEQPLKPKADLSDPVVRAARAQKREREPGMDEEAPPHRAPSEPTTKQRAAGVLSPVELAERLVAQRKQQLADAERQLADMKRLAEKGPGRPKDLAALNARRRKATREQDAQRAEMRQQILALGLAGERRRPMPPQARQKQE